MRSRVVAMVIAASLAVGTRVTGQAIRVRTVEDGSNHPLGGILISLRDLATHTVAQALTDEQGRTILQAPAAGSYLVRADRIGFLGATAGPFTVAGSDTVTVRLVLPAGRVRLPDVTVQGSKPVCTLAQENGTLMAALWSEARKALIGTEVTRRTSKPLLDVAIYERELDRNLRVARERSSSYQTATIRPFITDDPDSLSQLGFVRRAGADIVYYAPDAALLLSDQFLRDHCFRVVAHEQNPALIGLGFEPAPKHKLPDVQGALWVDRATSELREIEFGYTNLGSEQRHGNERGRVAFTRLPNGSWIVSEWVLRIGYYERGGDAGLAQTIPANRAAIHGNVFDSLAGRPLAGVVVSIAGGVYSDTTDALGGFRIETPTQGQFVVSFAHPRFGLLGLAPAVRSAALTRGRDGQVDFAIPSAPSFAGAACGGRPLRPDSEAVLVGQITDSTGASTPGEVEVRWGRVDVLRPGYRTVVGERGTRVRLGSDLDGRFRLCGVPIGIEVEIGAAVAGRAGAPLRRIPGPGVLAETVVVR